jgi:exosortase/archaeosortase family protein
MKISKFLSGKWGFVSEILIFMLITYGFHLIYRMNSEGINSWGWMKACNQFLIQSCFEQTLWIYQNILTIQYKLETGNIIRFSNLEAISVNTGCSGSKQILQVLVLFVLYPGPWLRKLWYIPIAVIAIYWVNVWRIAVLGYWRGYGWPYWDFLHDGPMRVLFYLVIFGFWYYWNEKIRKADSPLFKLFYSR